MKHLFKITVLVFFLYSCNSKQVAVKNTAKENTVTSTSKKIEYDVVIIEPGFETYLQTQAKRINTFSVNQLKQKNIKYVSEWNRRVLMPKTYDSSLYEMRIDYNSSIDYGQDLNYKLYQFFIFFQNKYKQNLLGTRVPTN